MKFHIVIARPETYAHSECFREVAEMLGYALRSLGHAAEIGDNTVDAQATNIVLGAHLLTEGDFEFLPTSTIIYNLEQLGGAMLPAWYLGLAARFHIWDYSVLNLSAWRQTRCLAPPILVEVGYVPELSRIVSAPEQDIDVLFYGSVNERRDRILSALEAEGVLVHRAFGVYGVERDRLIARAKIVLNIHAYETELFEMVRVSYLLTNAKAVVSELSLDAGDLSDAVAMYPHEGLVEGCISLLGEERRRKSLEELGAALFKERVASSILKAALAGMQQSSAAPTAEFPRRMNLGSGKDWREDCLNIDVNDYWRPDAVFDISKSLPAEVKLETSRFGTIALVSNCLDEILANDVLEHIPDLTTAMRSALDLLRVGGIFHIQVPYDLSFGAWQDPTHLRAFNERSWLYYTDWYWYLGWTEARFGVASLEFMLSPLGEQLKATLSAEELIRTPRAVDSMRVSLRKQLLSLEEKRSVQKYLQRPEARQLSSPAAQGPAGEALEVSMVQ